MSTFVFVIIRYKLVKNCISSVPKMLYDPLNSTKPNTTLKHYLLSKYFMLGTTSITVDDVREAYELFLVNVKLGD